MASISGTTNNLSSTLKGYGGMASGIDRDSIIEQMTLGTTTKISNVKKEKTELQWKQEAYRSLSDKVLDLQDNYFTYSSEKNLKSASVFAANLITAIGDDSSTKYISASGTSSMLDYLSILAVNQTASASTVLSGEKGGNQSIVTAISIDNLNTDGTTATSNLAGKKLEFGTYGTEDQWNGTGTFTFPTSYEKQYEYTVNNDGTVTCEKLDKSDTVYIDYTAAPEDLVKQLNEAIWATGTTIGEDRTIQFAYDSKSDAITMNYVGIKDQPTDETDVRKITITNLTDAELANANGNIKLRADSSALAGLNISTANADDKTIDFAVSGGLKSATGFKESYIDDSSMVGYLRGKSVTVSYGGDTESITLLTDEEYSKIQDIYEKLSDTATNDEKTKANIDAMDIITEGIQSRLNKAFGTGEEPDTNKVSVVLENGYLAFKSEDEKQTLTVNAVDEAQRKQLGLLKNQSNKVSTDASLWENREVLGFTDEYLAKKLLEVDSLDQYNDVDAVKAAIVEKYKITNTDTEIEKLYEEQLNKELKTFTINNVTIEDIDKDTTVNELLNKINDNDDVGVKASYLSGSGQFVLVAEKTGSGRKISLGAGVASTIFGGKSQDGRDAEMVVSYGNGVTTTVKSSSNTFNLEGMKVTVSGTFGESTVDAEGNTVWDASKAVTFEAEADVEGVTEQVKKFIEEYNALVEELYTQTSTRPDRDYGVLTEEQKDEMTEKEIENWEKKAKEGLLFGSSVVKELYSDVQNIFSQLKGNGISYSDLESIGITSSDTRADYGKLIFDESKFKEAMENDSKKVSNIFTGGGKVKKGLAQTMEDLFTPYATRYATKNGNSYGKLIEEAGSEKLILSVNDNFIYEQLKKMDEEIKTLQSRLKSEQDRYIKQFTSMESLISQYNTQSGYIAGLSG